MNKTVTLPAKLELIKAACREAIRLGEKASPAPWIAVPNDDCMSDQKQDGHTSIKDPDDWYIARIWESGLNTARDAAFIAHARTFSPLMARKMIELIEAITIRGNTGLLEIIAADWPDQGSTPC